MNPAAASLWGCYGLLLDWRPRVHMQQALKHTFDAYRTHVAEAQQPVE